MDVKDKVWQNEALTHRYLSGVRSAIPLANEQLDVMVRLVEATSASVTHILDLGCGDGILGQVLLDQYPQAQAVFADFSEPMLSAARTRLAAYNGRSTIMNVDYGQADWVKKLPTGKVSRFDVIVSGFSIHHQPDKRKQALYAEIFDLLNAGGIFINIEHVASHSPWGIKLFDAAFIDALVAEKRRSGSEDTYEQVAQTLYNREDKDANILATVENQCDWLREIGFENVDCYLKYFELAVFAGTKE